MQGSEILHSPAEAPPPRAKDTGQVYQVQVALGAVHVDEDVCGVEISVDQAGTVKRLHEVGQLGGDAVGQLCVGAWAKQTLANALQGVARNGGDQEEASAVGEQVALRECQCLHGWHAGGASLRDGVKLNPCDAGAA